MITEIGKFKTDSCGVIHIKSEAEEIELRKEIDNMSTKMWKDLPLVKLDYIKEKGEK